MVGTLAESDQGDVGPLPRCHPAHFPDVHRAGDHLVAEPCYDAGQNLEAVRPLIGDQDAQMMSPVHKLPSGSRGIQPNEWDGR